ncbi:MAG: SoxR reducing system RseC family protein [Bacteroidales bacterium]
MIDHAGVIEHIEGDRAQVRIMSESACAACHAKGACSAADQEEKFIDVELPGDGFHEGDPVRVEAARHVGLKAVAMGYLYPFLLLMAVLIGMVSAGVPDMKAGVAALLSLVPYYLLLFLLRGKIGSTFSFSLKKT